MPKFVRKIQTCHIIIPESVYSNNLIISREQTNKDRVLDLRTRLPERLHFPRQPQIRVRQFLTVIQIFFIFKPKSIPLRQTRLLQPQIKKSSPDHNPTILSQTRTKTLPSRALLDPHPTQHPDPPWPLNKIILIEIPTPLGYQTLFPITYIPPGPSPPTHIPPNSMVYLRADTLLGDPLRQGHVKWKIYVFLLV